MEKNMTPSFSIRRPRKRKQAEIQADRFIAKRHDSMESWADCSFNSTESLSPVSKDYSKRVKTALGLGKREILHFTSTVKTNHDPLKSLYKKDTVSIPKAPRDVFRNVPMSSFKILDAPDVSTDIYSNLTDWSKGNILAVALESTVYLWNAEEQTTNELVTFENNEIITCVKFCNGNSSLLSICTDDGSTFLFDIKRQKKIRSFTKKMQSNNVAAWSGGILTTGSRGCSIFMNDIRKKESEIKTLKNHKGQVISLSWNKLQKLASGSVDQTVSVYDMKADKVISTFHGHSSGIKGLAWSRRNNNRLVSGGLKDKTIKLWDIGSDSCVKTRKVSGGVTGIKFSRDSKKIVASVGKTLQLFTSPNLYLGKTLTGHDDQILNLSFSPSNTTVVSCSADETLRFWKVFDEEKPVTVSKPRTPQYITRRLR